LERGRLGEWEMCHLRQGFGDQREMIYGFEEYVGTSRELSLGF